MEFLELRIAYLLSPQEYFSYTLVKHVTSLFDKPWNFKRLMQAENWYTVSNRKSKEGIKTLKFAEQK